MADREDTVRMDKFLWAIRLYKTRALAKQACEKSWIQIAGSKCKPARAVQAGDIISVSDPKWLEHWGHIREVEVIEPTGRRVGASLVDGLARDLTQADPAPRDPHQAAMAKYAKFTVERGEGRPSKKDRRKYNAIEGRED